MESYCEKRVMQLWIPAKRFLFVHLFCICSHCQTIALPVRFYVALKCVTYMVNDDWIVYVNIYCVAIKRSFRIRPSMSTARKMSFSHAHTLTRSSKSFHFRIIVSAEQNTRISHNCDLRPIAKIFFLPILVIIFCCFLVFITMYFSSNQFWQQFFVNRFCLWRKSRNEKNEWTRNGQMNQINCSTENAEKNIMLDLQKIPKLRSIVENKKKTSRKIAEKFEHRPHDSRLMKHKTWTGQLSSVWFFEILCFCHQWKSWKIVSANERNRK